MPHRIAVDSRVHVHTHETGNDRRNEDLLKGKV